MKNDTEIEKIIGGEYLFAEILKKVEIVQYREKYKYGDYFSDIVINEYVSEIINYANKLLSKEIITPAQMLTIDSLLKKKLYFQLYDFIRLIYDQYLELRRQQIFREEFEKLIERNYKSVTEHRKLITENTPKVDHVEKIKEELLEFEYEFLNASDMNNKALTECSDIVLVCLNIMRHYGFNPLNAILDKIEFNENR